MNSATARLVRSLDWKTPGSAAPFMQHWRLSLSAVAGSIAAVCIWHELFPNTFWFIKLWAGLTTGSFAGMIPGLVWQLRDGERRSRTSGRFVVGAAMGWGLFAAISIFLIAPDLGAQEAERSRFRSLSPHQISVVFVRQARGPVRSIESRDAIASFVSVAKQAELFYPSHEGSEVQFEMTIQYRDGSSREFEGRVPERHPNDIALRFRGYFALDEIIIPGGRHWLDKVAPRGAG